jgi:hypothetical protein
MAEGGIILQRKLRTPTPNEGGRGVVKAKPTDV